MANRDVQPLEAHRHSLRRLFAPVAMAVLLCHASVATVAAAQPAYRFIPLESLGGTFSNALGLNNHGDIVGQSFTRSDLNQHATQWKVAANGAVTGPIDLGTLGGSYSAAEAINDKGQVVGYSATAEGPTRATTWKNGQIAALPTLGGLHSFARDINNAGQIAGQSDTGAYTPIGGNIYHATRWDNGVPMDLGTLGGTHSAGLAINARGEVVGDSLAARGSNLGNQATLWSEGAATRLDIARFSIATAVNDKGQVVGYEGGGRAFLWDNGVTTLLPGGWGGQAYDINNVGQIIGAGGSGAGPVLWEGGTMTELNSLLDDESRAAGWTVLEANAINDHGWIVGVASNSDYVYWGDSRIAYLMMPVPEPATVLLMLAGLAAIATAVNHRRSNVMRS